MSIKDCYAITHKLNSRVGTEVAHNYWQVADIHICVQQHLKVYQEGGKVWHMKVTL